MRAGWEQNSPRRAIEWISASGSTTYRTDPQQLESQLLVCQFVILWRSSETGLIRLSLAIPACVCFNTIS